MREAYRRTRKDGATGVDGVDAKQYAENLDGNLQSLLGRAKSGTYRAPPVRRVFIPKGDGSQRPLGIPTFEDKVLQRAIAMVLEAVYEQDFYDCSFGFRPGRSAHQALDTTTQSLMRLGGGFALEVDIRKYFDTLDHSHLQALLRTRIRDGVITRLVGKWLNAGVLDAGQLQKPEAGTPQGGVISPILANIYLHEVLDRWFVEQVRPCLSGYAFLVRYADDFVVGFTQEGDARKFQPMLAERFAQYGLSIHPEKTRLVDLRRPDRRPPRGGDSDGGGPAPRSIDLLGFRLFWGKARSGKLVVKQRTAPSRLSRTLKRLGELCRKIMHRPVAEQHHALMLRVRGFANYFGVIGNWASVDTLCHFLRRTWFKWLKRRSQRSGWTWAKMNRLLVKYPITLRAPVT
jgi:group II intron reverse transcriptase/maturase